MCAITNWWDNWKWLRCAWKKAVKNIPDNPTKAQTKYESPSEEKQTGKNWKVPKLRKKQRGASRADTKVGKLKAEKD